MTMTRRPRRPPWGRRPPPRERPRLMFAPLAWLKLQFLCHAGPTEVAGFGLSAVDDPLYLEDVLLVRQQATAATVVFDDAAVADLFDAMTDAEVPPARFARVWLHTHPGASAEPSWTDEATFDRAFGGCDWAVMAILGRTGRTFARLRFSAGPGGSVRLRTAVDWTTWPAAATDPERPLSARMAAWAAEYAALVGTVPALPPDAVRFDDVFTEGAGALAIPGVHPAGGPHDID